MSQLKFITLLALCLVVSTLAAPAEPEKPTTPASGAEPSPASSASTEPEKASTPVSVAEPSSSTTPASSSEATSTSATSTEASSMPVSSAQDPAHTVNTTFTCYNRKVGYYADPDTQCKVYHFCLLGDYNGQEVYQRISYLCLNNTVFDQQALDCVEANKVSSPCPEASKYYDESNAVLRKAIVGKPSMSEGGEVVTPSA